MWSKTKQILESRLCLKLKNRVKFHYDVYKSNKDKEKKWWFLEMRVFSILVDGKIWFATNPNYYDELYKLPYSQRYSEEGKLGIIKNFGYVQAVDNGSDNVMTFVHKFLNELSFDESIANENYFIRLLALLDKRLGKRRVKTMLENVENEPEWFQKWIRLRG